MPSTRTISPRRSKRLSGGEATSQSMRKRGKQNVHRSHQADMVEPTPQCLDALMTLDPAKGVDGQVSTTATVTRRVTSKAIAAAEGSRLFSWFKPTEEGFVAIYKAPILTQVEWVKTGVGARDAKIILEQLRVPQGEALTALHIPVATVNRKAKTNAHLSPAESERVLGVGRLLGQLQTMIRESGDMDGFDAPAWLSAWMSTPVPALGGARPLDLMDTMTGQALVSQTIAQMQSGAYA